VTDDRAEQAFRAALATRAAEYQPEARGVPLAHPRRRWPAVLAAAVLLVAVVLTGAALHSHGHRNAAPAELPSGWRWESHANVMVAVPDAWGYAYAPDDQWCTQYDSDGKPQSPRTAPLPPQGYVDTSLPGDASTSVLCAGGEVPPTALFVVHLSFLDHSEPTPVPLGWSDVTRTVGGVGLDVVTDQEHRALADRILATAHVFSTDQNGCSDTSPIQDQLVGRPSPPFDVDSLHQVDSIAVCQYQLDATGPALVASQLLTGASADAELTALQSASTNGGPDRGHGCSPADRGPTGTALLLRSGHQTHEMYAFYSGCARNGIDDGTNVRELTAENCRPLFGPRVIDGEGIGAAFEACNRRGH
jgi:hypothetical protein